MKFQQPMTARLRVQRSAVRQMTENYIQERVKDNPREVMAEILRNQRELADLLAQLLAER